MIAAIGRWSAGYGLRPNNLDLHVTVSADASGLTFSPCHTAQTMPTTMTIEEIHDEPPQNTLSDQQNQLAIVPGAPAMSPASRGHVSSPLTNRITSDPPGLGAVNAISLPSGPVVTHGHRTRPAAPISTIKVRRSNRSNKFNDFKS